MFPAVALAEELKKRGHHVVVVTDERAQKYENRTGIFDLEILKVTSPAGSILKKMKSAISLALGYFCARKILKKYKPSVVVGFGGYPSFPTILAAQHMRRHLGVRNIIHEQNAVIGKANLTVARGAHKIAISLPRVIGLSSEEQSRVAITGNPVREEIRKLYDEPYPQPTPDQRFNIFLIGGSQGASVFSDVVPEALSRLSEPDRARLHVVQQCRAGEESRTIDSYQKSGVSCEVQPFFYDVPDQLRKSHLVIARSGASTVAEVTMAGRPAIFVPYPWHKDQQQKMNADVIADNGGAWVMAQDGFTPDSLHARLLTFLQDPGILTRAAVKSKDCAMPNAAQTLADLIEDVIRM